LGPGSSVLISGRLGGATTLVEVSSSLEKMANRPGSTTNR
jgi:hypothetical protein